MIAILRSKNIGDSVENLVNSGAINRDLRLVSNIFESQSHQPDSIRGSLNNFRVVHTRLSILNNNE